MPALEAAEARRLPVGVPAEERLAFEVSRNGSPLGRHTIAFRPHEHGLDVEVEARFAWKLGFVALYRYTLRGREVWRDGRLESAAFGANNNGAKAHMTLQRAEGALRVEGSATRPYRAPADWLPATHWNARQLAAPMINPQDGAVLRYHVAEAGVATAPGANGPARRFRLKGENPLELWYDSNLIWVGLRARVFDGSFVEYRRCR